MFIGQVKLIMCIVYYYFHSYKNYVTKSFTVIKAVGNVIIYNEIVKIVLKVFYFQQPTVDFTTYFLVADYTHINVWFLIISSGVKRWRRTAGCCKAANKVKRSIQIFALHSLLWFLFAQIHTQACTSNMPCSETDKRIANEKQRQHIV